MSTTPKMAVTLIGDGVNGRTAFNEGAHKWSNSHFVAVKSVKSSGAPPGSPSDGDTYLLYSAGSFSGAWSGLQGTYQQWQGGAWTWWDQEPGQAFFAEDVDYAGVIDSDGLLGGFGRSYFLASNGSPNVLAGLDQSRNKPRYTILAGTGALPNAAGSGTVRHSVAHFRGTATPPWVPIPTAFCDIGLWLTRTGFKTATKVEWFQTPPRWAPTGTAVIGDVWIDDTNCHLEVLNVDLSAWSGYWVGTFGIA